MGDRPRLTMATKTLPKHEANEFGGAGGCIGVMLGLPFGIWALYVVCNDKFVLPLPFGPSGLVWRLLPPVNICTSSQTEIANRQTEKIKRICPLSHNPPPM